MKKTHLYDLKHERKIPEWDENKLAGYRATACGYQRKNVSVSPAEVNCKLCLKEIDKRIANGF